jgi:signal transduction histidine kinase
MNRKILLQVTGPAVVIGLILLATCLAGAAYISKLQTNLASVLSANVRNLEAAQELEIRVRQLRFHSFLQLFDPSAKHRQSIDDDRRRFEESLAVVREFANTPQEQRCLQAIEQGYERYQRELARLPAEAGAAGNGANLGKLADAHPVLYIVEPCQELLRINKEAMRSISQESSAGSRRALITLFFLGLAGPAGGLIIGYGVARGLSRSIYQLSVRIQSMARRLDHDVASVNIAADGDLQKLDHQLEHVVRRVEDVAQRVQQQEQDMIRAEQLSAVGQLGASVAHEVRNPLTSIKLLVDAALRTKNCKPLSTEDLQVIRGEIIRLEQTVQALLDFARLPAPQRSTFDLREAINQAIELVGPRARQQQVTNSTHAGDNEVLVDADRSQVHTVLVNLFLNSLEAMPDGGDLEVCLERTPGNEARISISDTGKGIPPEMIGRLFTPFASTKPTGTGLGLNISRRIIEEHGGRISAANRAERGACFVITLPTAHESQFNHKRLETGVSAM